MKPNFYGGSAPKYLVLFFFLFFLIKVVTSRSRTVIEAFLLLLFPSSPIILYSLLFYISFPLLLFFLSFLIYLSACFFVSLLFLFISESWARDGNYVETYIKSAAVIDHSPMNKFAMKTSDSNNDSILTGEQLNQEPTAKPDGIAMNSKAHIKKEEEDASAAEEGVILDTEGKRAAVN